MLIAIAIAEEIQGSMDCIGARTQQRTSLGLVWRMNFDDLRPPPGRMFANSIRARAHSHGHAHDCRHAHARGYYHGHEKYIIGNAHG